MEAKRPEALISNCIATITKKRKKEKEPKGINVIDWLVGISDYHLSAVIFRDLSKEAPSATRNAGEGEEGLEVGGVCGRWQLFLFAGKHVAGEMLWDANATDRPLEDGQEKGNESQQHQL
ncbi:hypothetical protein ACLOJK_011617 [Asimina triloba]